MNMINEDKKVMYKTSDLALATTLVYFDFILDSLDRENPKRVIFIFEQTPELEEFINKYWKGGIKIEPQKFFQTQKILKVRLYSER